MYSAVDIATIFVDKGIKECIPVTQMQLQKLVYFANGLLLAYTNGKESLVNESFQAWNYGPVIPSIYQAYKQFGSEPITPENDFQALLGGKAVNFEPIQINNDLHRQVIDEIWESLKNLSGIELSQITHRDKSAWSKARTGDLTRIELDKDAIVSEFKPFLKKKEDAAGK